MSDETRAEGYRPRTPRANRTDGYGVTDAPMRTPRNRMEGYGVPRSEPGPERNRMEGYGVVAGQPRAERDRTTGYFGSGGGGGSNGGNIFNNFGRDIGRNPLGAVSNFLNDGVNRPVANLYRGQGQVWQAAGRSAQFEGNYYRQAGRTDGARAAYGDGLYADVEYGRVANQAARLNRNGAALNYQNNRPQNYGGNAQLPPQYGYNSAPPQQSFNGYYGQPNPYAPGFQPQPGYQQQQGYQPPQNPNLGYQQAPPVYQNQPPVAPLQPRANQGANGANIPPVTQPSAVNMPPQGAAPVQPQSQPSAPAKVEVVAVQAGNGKKAHAFNEKFPALPADANQIRDIQRNLIAAGFEVGPKLGEADGKSGRRTWTAFETICAQAKPPIDPRAVNFRDPKDADTVRFNEVLKERIAQHQTSKQSPAAGREASPQAPATAQLQAQQAAAAAQAEGARRAADAREIPVLLNTAYDSRNLATMDINDLSYDSDRYRIARHTLLALGELKSENKQHNLENMHDKMKEAVRKANDIVGREQFRMPTEAQPFTDDAMTALGIVAAKRGELQQDLGASVYDRKTANHAADKILDALRIPSGPLSERVATVEAQVGLWSDGQVDPAMLRAAQAIYAEKAGLALVGVRGGYAMPPSAEVTPQASMPAPGTTPPRAPQK